MTEFSNKEFYSQELRDTYPVISRYFEIRDFYQYDQRLIYLIPRLGDVKEKFKSMSKELKDVGYLSILDAHDVDTLEITVIKKLATEKSSVKRPIILFIATVATIIIDGYLRSAAPLFYDLIPGYNPWYTTIIFTISLLAIVGIHEMGHKTMLSIYNIEASLPNFIPGVPGILPTFGAVISQKEIPINRDELFDIGMAGPIAGLIATLIVSIYSVITAPIISQETYSLLEAKYGHGQPFPVPPLYTWLIHLVRPIPPGNYVIIVTPIVWAAVVGFLLTGLNLLPAWQLDGGHIARAVVGEKYHTILTMIAIAILIVSGYVVMGILVLFLYMLSGGRSVRPLDDLSPVSLWRKIAFIILIALAFLCLPFPILS
jgi:Zn-dependent protease